MTYRFLLTALVITVRMPAADTTAPALPSVPPVSESVTMPGLGVGEKAVDFILPNTEGKYVALQGLLKSSKVALVFVRSADWCPFCRKQLQDLQTGLPEIAATGAQLVAISYDAPATNAAAAAKLGLSFPLLSDPGSKIIDAYGIRNLEAKGRGVGIPHPVVFILDQQGMIRVKLMRDGYKVRPESAEIIAGANSFK